MGIDETIARIRAFQAARGWTKSRLAAEAGLQDTVLRHIDSESWNPTTETLRRIESVIPPEWRPSSCEAA